MMRHPRVQRVQQELKEEVSKILTYELSDPRLEMVTITAVELTDDLRFAKIYYSVMGDQKRREKAQQGLESATGFIRKLIGERIRLKFLPEIVFKYDNSIEYAQHISEVLEKIKKQQKGGKDADKKSN